MGWRNLMTGDSRTDNKKNRTPRNLPKIPKTPVEVSSKPIFGDIGDFGKGFEKVKNLQSESNRESFFDHQMSAVIEELDRAGINFMAFPPSTRHRAFLMEQELTEAANEGDRARFLDLLKRWRGCFH